MMTVPFVNKTKINQNRFQILFDRYFFLNLLEFKYMTDRLRLNFTVPSKHSGPKDNF